MGNLLPTLLSAVALPPSPPFSSTPPLSSSLPPALLASASAFLPPCFTLSNQKMDSFGPCFLFHLSKWIKFAHICCLLHNSLVFCATCDSFTFSVCSLVPSVSGWSTVFFGPAGWRTAVAEDKNKGMCMWIRYGGRVISPYPATRHVSHVSATRAAMWRRDVHFMQKGVLGCSNFFICLGSESCFECLCSVEPRGTYYTTN